MSLPASPTTTPALALDEAVDPANPKDLTKP